MLALEPEHPERRATWQEGSDSKVRGHPAGRTAQPGLQSRQGKSSAEEVARHRVRKDGVRRAHAWKGQQWRQPNVGVTIQVGGRGHVRRGRATELVTSRQPDQIIRYCGRGPLTARKGTKNGKETTRTNPVGLDW